MPDGSSPAQPLRVLSIDYAVGFGGATKSLGLVTRDLRDVSLRILTSQDPEEVQRWYAGIPVEPFRRVVNYQNLERVRARIPAGAVGWLPRKAVAAVALAATRWNARKLARLLTRHPVDVVHLNNGFTPPEVLEVVRRRGIPTVVHMRGFPSVEDVRAESRGVTRVIAVSTSIAAVVTQGGFPREHTPVVWDPVDLALFERTRDQRDAIRARHGIAPDEVAVGLFGRVVRWKGTLEFVHAAARALAAGARIRPVIVGDVSDGTRDYLAEVRAAIAASPFADRFVLAGYQPSPEGHYHAMDIVVHASIEPEPFGMVVPEGMAAGKPIIAAAAGGPLDVIEPEVDGLLTPPGDVAALAAAMQRLAANPGLRTRFGERGAVKVRERLAIGPAAAALLRVWREAAGERLAQVHEAVPRAGTNRVQHAGN